jgi:protease IV
VVVLVLNKKKNSFNFILLSVILLIALFLFVLFSFLFINFASFSNNTIAVIPIKGEITSSESYSILSGFELSENIEFACNNSVYSGILLDVDSPGGEIVASKQIVYAVRDCEKPIVSYIAGIGASGAYYVASASDFIVADADSITGSIGVISLIPNISGLFENLGIEMQVIQAGDFKSMGSIFKELNEDEKKLFEELINEIYLNFKADILEFRKDKLTEFNLNSVADGRIISGRQALKLNLIDDLGTKKDAVNKLNELSGFSDSESNLEYFNKKEFSLMELFFSAGLSFAEGFKTSLNSSNNLKIYS